MLDPLELKWLTNTGFVSAASHVRPLARPRPRFHPRADTAELAALWENKETVHGRAEVISEASVRTKDATVLLTQGWFWTREAGRTLRWTDRSDGKGGYSLTFDTLSFTVIPHSSPVWINGAVMKRRSEISPAVTYLQKWVE